jgi:hypothetical protein
LNDLYDAIYLFQIFHAFLLENKHIVAVFNLAPSSFASLETAFLQVVNQVKSDMVRREVFVWKQGYASIFDLYLQEH